MIYACVALVSIRRASRAHTLLRKTFNFGTRRNRRPTALRSSMRKSTAHATWWCKTLTRCSNAAKKLNCSSTRRKGSTWLRCVACCVRGQIFVCCMAVWMHTTMRACDFSFMFASNLHSILTFSSTGPFPKSSERSAICILLGGVEIDSVCGRHCPGILELKPIFCAISYCFIMTVHLLAIFARHWLEHAIRACSMRMFRRSFFEQIVIYVVAAIACGGLDLVRPCLRFYIVFAMCFKLTLILFLLWIHMFAFSMRSEIVSDNPRASAHRTSCQHW